jgi:hypothetical protein
MSSMLEQAIVDAKALKEAAMKNAEAIVIEKYASEIREAVNSLLDETPEEDPMELTDDELAADEMGEIPAGPQAAELDPTAHQLPDSFKNAEAGAPIEINLEELSAEVTAAMGEMESHEAAAEDMEAAPLQEPPSATPAAPEVSQTPLEEANDDNEEVNENEEEINEENEEEINEEDDEDINLNEAGLLDLLEKMVVDALPTKSGWMNRPDAELQHEENIALAKAASEEDVNENEEPEEANDSVVTELQEQNKILASASLKLQNENERYREAVVSLKGTLESTNLSNAKLLYINQTLVNASLNERQKQKIVEAISRTETVKEAKVIFETLQGTVGASSREKTPQSLSEAVTRKPSLMVAARRNQQPTDTQSPFFDRMQKLAGIQNNK